MSLYPLRHILAMTKHFIQLFILLSLFFIANYAIADDEKKPTNLKEVAEQKENRAKAVEKIVKQPNKGPSDKFNRSTPASSILGLTQSLKDKDFERATNYLDLRNLPFSVKHHHDGADLARKLAIVAVRTIHVDLASLSTEPAGHSDDGLPSYRDRITTITTQNGPIDILMQRVPREDDGVFIWKMSNATIAKLPELYDEFGYGPIGDKLAQIFPDYEILDFEIWQIVMLIGLIFISLAIGYLITFPVMKILQYKNILAEHRVRRFLVGPIRFFIAIIIFRHFFYIISPSPTIQAVFEAKTIFIIAVLWVLLGMIDLAISRLSERMKRNGQSNAVVLLKPASTGIKIVLLLLAIVTWLGNIGYEITAIIAGLGIGGVAIALASQKSLENLIGSITIYAAQPIKVGDFCQFGNTLGTVEEIGLRATQIRTLARTIVHIPNAKFASEEIENLTQRDKILYRCRLRLSYQATPAQIRAVLTGIRQLIEQDEHIDTETSRVRFIEFAEYAQELELYVYLTTKDFVQYLEYKEEVNLAIIDILAQQEVKLIVPAHTTYLEKAADIPNQLGNA